MNKQEYRRLDHEHRRALRTNRLRKLNREMSCGGVLDPSELVPVPPSPKVLPRKEGWQFRQSDLDAARKMYLRALRYWKDDQEKIKFYRERLVGYLKMSGMA